MNGIQIEAIRGIEFANAKLHLNLFVFTKYFTNQSKMGKTDIVVFQHFLHPIAELRCIDLTNLFLFTSSIFTFTKGNIFGTKIAYYKFENV